MADAAALSSGIANTGDAAVYGIHFDTGKADAKVDSAAAVAEVKEIAKLPQQDPGLKICAQKPAHSLDAQHRTLWWLSSRSLGNCWLRRLAYSQTTGSFQFARAFRISSGTSLFTKVHSCYCVVVPCLAAGKR